MIKTIYKGKKNLFVVVSDGGNKTTNVSEFNFKNKTWFNNKVIPSYSLNDYVVSKALRAVTLQEFIDAYEESVTKAAKKVNDCKIRIKNALDIKKNAELRHFYHEVINSTKPLITEGLLKIYTLVGKLIDLEYILSSLTKNVETVTDGLVKSSVKTIDVEFTEEENTLFEKFYKVVQDETLKSKQVIDENEGVCRSIVRHGQYIFDNKFDDVVLDELPEDVDGVGPVDTGQTTVVDMTDMSVGQ